MTSFTEAEACHLLAAGTAPLGMKVSGHLNLRGPAITALPEGLTVDGNLILMNTAVATLPRGLTVGGALYLSGTSVAALSGGLVVGGGLYLRRTAVTELPGDIAVGGELDLGWTAVTALPEGLTVDGYLYLRGSAVTALPPRLSVAGSIFMDQTAITALPDDLVVGGRLHLDQTRMRFPTGWYRETPGGKRWRALASAGGYTLLQSETGQIIAGCRGPWTREEALAHWGDPARTDDRARRFVAALRDPEIDASVAEAAEPDGVARVVVTSFAAKEARHLLETGGAPV